MTRKVEVVTFSLPPAYNERIERIKQKLGVSSKSEVIRKAIDDLAVKLGVLLE